MISNHDKQVMIAMLFKKGFSQEGWNSCKTGEDFFGRFFYFQYPGADTNKYYFGKDVILDDWEMLKDIFSITKLKTDDTTLIYYKEKYYNIGKVHYYTYSIPKKSKKGRHSLGSNMMTFTVSDDFYNDRIEYNVKTEMGFKKIFNKLNPQEVTF